MSIFGNTRPKFIKDDIEFPLMYSKTIVNEPVYESHMHESIINLHREWVDVGVHYEFQCIVFLYKYGSEAKDYYNYLNSCYKQEVDKLYPYSDGDCLRNIDEQPVKFKLYEMIPYYFNTDEYPDYVHLKFKSSEPVELQNILINPLELDPYLWFAEDTLQASGGNYVWTDKVSGVVSISGPGSKDYLKGKTALRCDGTGADSVINWAIPEMEEFTFVCALKHNHPPGCNPRATGSGGNAFDCHRFGPGLSDRFKMSQYIYTSPCPGPSPATGLVFNTRIYGQVGFKWTGTTGEGDSPYQPTIAIIRCVGNQYILSHMRGKLMSSNVQENETVVWSYTNGNINYYDLTSTWRGLIGEFMFFNRFLNNEDTNKIGKYFGYRYAGGWSNI